MQTPQSNNGNHNANSAANSAFDLEKLASESETTVLPLSYTEGTIAPSPYFPHEMKNEEEAGFDVRDFLRRVQRRKWLILTIVAIATLMAAVNSSRQKSIFMASTTVEVGNNKNQTFVKDGDFYYRDDNQEIETATFLIQSHPLLIEVVANFGLDQNKKFLDATEQKSIWDVLKNKQKTEPQPTDEPQETVPTNFDVSIRQRSPEEINRLAPFADILSGGLTVEKVKMTRLIRVNFRHTDPEIAALVANGVAQVFREKSYVNKTSVNKESSTSLNKATRELEAQMQKADQALADYTRTNGIFSLEGKEDLTANKLIALHEQTMRAATDRIIKQSLYEDARQGRVAQLPEALSNQQTNDLQKRLSELNIAAAQLNIKYGPENPRIAEVRDQMEVMQKDIVSTRTQLVDKLKTDYERSVRDEAAMNTLLSRAKGEAVQQNQTSIQFNILKQKAETAKTLYTDFLQKTSQVDLEAARVANDISIAEPARVPGGPIGPSRTRPVILAFLLSLAASIGLVFLLDHLDNTIKTVEDVSRYVRLPALGVIPAIGVNGHRLTLNVARQEKNALPTNGILSPKDAYKSAGSVAEAYRMLRTSILLAAAGQPPKTVLVTSSQPGEGKTTTTINTSICLSQLGATVLLIDADMRRPRIHKILGIDHRKGLSNYLSSDMSLKTVVQPTKVPNLYVLPSGIVPPNSADLLSSEKFRLMLQKLSQHFDHILIDSPPIGSVTDPIIMSRLVDGVMLIVHGGKSSREMVVHSRQELASVGAKIFGVVLNNVNLARDGYSTYYKRYQYEYSRESNQVS
ncbi:MAG: polysaccharide biosynthesis tyrosine autokinase [Acidobacteria bacterium]|nr:polysaccharide biosynthesis tyrosine autokinase [Acidobacteriota bacterium]